MPPFKPLKQTLAPSKAMGALFAPPLPIRENGMRPGVAAVGKGEEEEKEAETVKIPWNVCLGKGPRKEVGWIKPGLSA